MNKIDIHFVGRNIDEFEELLWLFKEVFESEEEKIPNREYLQKLLDNESLLILVAKSENKVVGGLTAYILPSYQQIVSNIYIYDLGVEENFRNKGIGKN